MPALHYAFGYSLILEMRSLVDTAFFEQNAHGTGNVFGLDEIRKEAMVCDHSNQPENDNFRLVVGPRR